MKKLLVGLVTAATLASTASFAKEAEKNTCVPLKDFTVEKAKDLLKEYLKGGVKIIGTGKSPVKSLYEVDVDVNGRRFPVYVDCGLKYLVMGSIIDISSKKNLTKERGEALTQQAIEERKKEIAKYIGEEKVEKLKKVLGPRFQEVKVADLKALPETKEGMVVLGNPKGKTTIYVVDDPECPFCAKLDAELKKLLEKRKDLKVEVILFPLDFHKHAAGISANIVCANDNKKKAEILEKSFEAVRNRNISKLSDLELKEKCKDKDVNEILRQNFMFARSVGVSGTPTLIFPGGIVISGYMSADQLEKILDALTSDNKSKK